MNKPLVSVIVPVFNVEKFLSLSIESILQQTYKNIEIILINDGSTDRSKIICERYLEKDKRVKLINQNNQGLSYSRNVGLDICSGDYILFVDSDDTIDIHLIESDLSFFTSDIDIVFHQIKYFGEKTGILKSKPTGCYDSIEVLSDFLLDQIGSQVVRGLYRANVWKGVRFPVGRFYEDIATTYKAVFNSKKIFFNTDVNYNYRINEGTISTTFNPDKSFHIFLGFYEKVNFIIENNLSCLNDCICIASNFGISSYFYHLMYKKNEQISLVKKFLKNNKRIILSKRNKNRNRKFLIFSYLYCFPLFYLVCLILKIFKY